MKKTLEILQNKIHLLKEKVYEKEVLYEELVKSIVDNLEFISNNYSYLVSDPFSDFFRYEDYYEPMMNSSEALNYFDENFFEDSKEKRQKEFSLFLLLKKIEDLIILFDDKEFSDINSVIDMYKEEELQDIFYISEELKALIASKMEIKENKLLEFLKQENKYRILFDGFIYSDLQSIPTNILEQIAYKINEVISKQINVPGMELLQHTKDLKGVNFYRIHLAADYRLVFYRHDNTVVIVGFTRKANHALEYSRYDAVANNIEIINKNILLFNENLLPQDHQHYSVEALLEEKLSKTDNIVL